jgi:hypothetical protein
MKKIELTPEETQFLSTALANLPLQGNAEQLAPALALIASIRAKLEAPNE